MRQGLLLSRETQWPFFGKCEYSNTDSSMPSTAIYCSRVLLLSATTTNFGW